MLEFCEALVVSNVLSSFALCVVLFLVSLVGVAGIFLYELASRTAKNSIHILLVPVCWLVAQILLGLWGVYAFDINAFPPNIFLLGIAPALCLIILSFSNRKSRSYLNSLSSKRLNYIHVFRVPVELVLLGLSIQKLIPQIMTFEGRNFDILAGITAPIVGWLVFRKGAAKKWLVFWNLACLCLLLNIVILALLSAPSPLQQFGFQQPNIGIFMLPYCYLPTIVVPIVLWAHLVSLFQLLFSKKRSIRLKRTER